MFKFLRMGSSEAPEQKTPQEYVSGILLEEAHKIVVDYTGSEEVAEKLGKIPEAKAAIQEIVKKTSESANKDDLEIKPEVIIELYALRSFEHAIENVVDEYHEPEM